MSRSEDIVDRDLAIFAHGVVNISEFAKKSDRQKGNRNDLNSQNNNNSATTLHVGEIPPDGPDSAWILADGALHSTP